MWPMFTVCFAVWMMFGVIGIPIKKTLGPVVTKALLPR
jgi:NNP family nitrate/nitrite transporter-like MFS transporter